MASTSADAAAVGVSAKFRADMIDLVEVIDHGHVECLNEEVDLPFANALKKGYREDAGLVCASDADEQLLVNIPFSQVVKLHSLTIAGDASDGGKHAPRTIHLYANRPSMGFSDTESMKPTQTITLASADEATVDLAFVKFQNVNTLTVFFADNLGDEDVTRVSKLAVFGNTVHTTNMSELKKC